jgi:hypothetical protein
MGRSGHLLDWPLAGLAMGWFSYELLGWTWTALAIVWWSHVLGQPCAGLPIGCSFHELV